MIRDYRTGQTSRGTFQLAETDPDLQYVDPRLGVQFWFETESYPLVWAGQVVDVSGRPSSGEVMVEARSFEALLQERLLPSTYLVSGTAGKVVRQLVEEIERTNPLGLQLPDDIASGPVLDTLSLGDRTLFDALTTIANITGYEWWLEHEAVRGELVTSLQFSPARGQDRTEVLLTTGPWGNVQINGWRINTEGTAHRLRAIGGQGSATQAFSERSRVERRLSAASPVAQALLVAAPVTRHGYTFGRFPTGDSILSRTETLAILEGVRGTGALAIAAEALLIRRRPERSVDLSVLATDTDLWARCLPGDVVLADFPAPTLVTGYRGPVAILATQPMEQLGLLHLRVEVPGAD